ncbi:pilus assembly protein [Bifidobacterium sp. 82T24]|uniref:type II secretion system F family protein n=1 Tax=Bifidobacterium pluvialisilvae TaxID=2834436 RepID=UPI001C56158D|nr:pilus assembly protein [Bifidobacterium pluvialisilvae]MBW3088302.1 pilus assembly protein [Bifidobacterium pluvialisilvae]
MMAVLAAVASGLAVGCSLWDVTSPWRRLCGLGDVAVRSVSRMGLAAALSSMSAFIRNGGTASGALEELAGRRFATAAVTEERAVEVFEHRRGDDETPEQARRVARDVFVACRVSERLGCETVRCLSAVASSYARSRLVEDLEAKAMAMPRSTVRLLSALPAVTVLLGEMLGARPLAFLFGTMPGLLCLSLGALCYAVGLAWVGALMRRLHDDVGGRSGGGADGRSSRGARGAS